MKKLFPFLIFLVSLNFAEAQQSPTDDSSLAIIQDTLKDVISYSSNNFTIARAPYEHGAVSILLNNRNAFGQNAGVNVLNLLRGQVPNSGISPAASISGLSIRGTASALVIDGVPVSQEFSKYYNLNASEYEQITVVSSNANVLSGSSALAGATMLTSKTGKGYDDVTFEVNSYSTLGWSKGQASFLNSDSESSKYWNINNGLAYMQDFGKVDTRVSFNYGSSPVRSSFDSNSHNSTLRINTGFEIHPMLSMRVILDRAYSFGRTEPVGNDMFVSRSFTEKDLTQGTLIVNLKPADWFQLNMQHSITEIDRDISARSDYSRSLTKEDQNRKFHKALATLFPSQGKKLNTSVYIGVQQEDIDQDFATGTLSGNGSTGAWSKRRYLQTSTVAGTTLSLHDYLFADLNIRRDRFSYLPKGHNKYEVKTAGLSFHFLKAFGWESKSISLGRIRTSIGDAELTAPMLYPVELTFLQNFTPPTGEKNRELGVDLGFANNRLIFSATRFKRIMEDVYVRAPLPPWGAPGGGAIPGYFSLGEYHTSGWELTLATMPILRTDTRLDTKLIWTKGKTEVINDNPDLDFTAFGNVTPDWNASLLNQFSWKKLFINCVVEIREGGDIVYLVDNEAIIKDGSYGKLRELGIGVQLGSGNSGLGVRKLALSVTGRNLLTFYTPSGGKDAEELMMAQYIKSVSAGLSVTF